MMLVRKKMKRELTNEQLYLQLISTHVIPKLLVVSIVSFVLLLTACIYLFIDWMVNTYRVIVIQIHELTKNRKDDDLN